MSSSRIKNFWFFCVLFLITSIVTLLSAEAVIRIYIKMQGTKLGIKRIEHFSRSWPLFKEVKGKKYFYELKPSITKTLEGFEYQINDQGLRDNKEKFYSDPNDYNIMLVGASQTFSVGVSFEDTWGALLEKKLNNHYGPRKRSIRIWNGGVPGYSLEQNVGAFKQKYSKLNPDMMILTFLVDVFVRPSWRFKGGILYVPEKSYWFQQLVYRSRLLSFLAFRFKNQRFNPFNYYNDYYGQANKKWGGAMEQVQDLSNFCKEKGIKLVVLDLTTPFWKGRLKKEDWIEYQYNVKLEAFCKERGINYHNVISCFEGLEAGPLWAIPEYDCHYNSKATALVAENLFQYLVKLNF